MGNSDGTFQPEATYTAGTSAGDVAIGDFDGDGIPDLIATGATSIYLLHGIGDGTFNTAQAIPVGFGTFVVAAGDFNADGKLDLRRHEKLGRRRASCSAMETAPSRPRNRFRAHRSPTES